MTSKQELYITQNFDKKFTVDIANAIGESRDDVVRYIARNGIDMNMRKNSVISTFDGEYIKENYYNLSSEQIGKRLGLKNTQVRGWITNHMKDKPNGKRRKFDTDFFREIDTNEKAYYLGLIYADGWVSHSEYKISGRTISSTYEFGIELQRSDRYLLEELSRSLGGVHEISDHVKDIVICNNTSKSHSEMSKLRIYSKDIVNGLVRNGISFNKTKQDIHPIVSEELFLPFLKGYIDGDGCIHRMNPRSLGVHITSCRKNILIYVNDMVERVLGFRTSIYTENENKHRIYWFTQTKVQRLLDAIYKIQTPELKRKRSVYEEFYGLSDQ